MSAPSSSAQRSNTQRSNTPCRGYAVAVLFPDVEPAVLAAEAATEQGRAGVRAGEGEGYLRRALPALERDAPVEMAEALLAAGHGSVAAVSHADAMRRRALAAGNVRRARFWADVATAAAGRDG